MRKYNLKKIYAGLKHGIFCLGLCVAGFALSTPDDAAPAPKEGGKPRIAIQ